MKTWMVLGVWILALCDLVSAKDNNWLANNEALVCHDHTVSQLSVTFKNDGRGLTARLESFVKGDEHSDGRFIGLADLRCYRSASERAPSPDLPVVVSTCTDPNAVDTGFELTLTSADLTGVRWVTVRELRFVGPRELAKLICKAVKLY